MSNYWNAIKQNGFWIASLIVFFIIILNAERAADLFFFLLTIIDRILFFFENIKANWLFVILIGLIIGGIIYEKRKKFS